MKCPFCGNVDSRVSDSRAIEDGSAIRRRRACEACGERFTTVERPEEVVLTVVKRDGTAEPFSRDKLYRSVFAACGKRNITSDQIDALVAAVENAVKGRLGRDVKSEDIGELVMEKLKSLDEVAYVRFASVYRSFKDIDSFMGELTKLLKEKAE